MVLSGWPRVSETFALNELLALEAAGLLAVVVATKPGDLALVQPAVARLQAPVHVLADGSLAEQTDELVALASGRVDALHGYFAHRPASLAEAAGRRLGVPFGFSAHALDVRKVDGDELRRRATAAACVIACNPETARSLKAVGAPVTMLAHGVDTTGFAPTPLPSACAGLELLAVARLVAKKGFPVLVEAMAKVATPVRLRIVGDGPERGALEAAIERFGVGDRVRLLGRTTHDALPSMFASVHAVVVPSVVDGAGDRDGLPNVVLEAMACGRAVVASDVAAIAQAVRPDDTGLLVPPNDPIALADALGALAARPERCGELGERARRMVEQEYELTSCTARFVQALEKAYG